MLDTLRAPFFIIAVVSLVICVLVEIGSPLLVGLETPEDLDVLNPGIGIPYLAIVDGLLLFTVGLIASPMIISHRAHGRIQGLATFIFSLLLLLGSIVLILLAIGLLILMISLLLAVPFGTLFYMSEFSSFRYREAASAISLIFILKIAFSVFLVLAHQRFLENKGLIFLVLTSLGVTLLLSFLLNISPSFLRSITDDISAIVTGIVGAVWSIIYLIGSIPAIFKALRIYR